VSVFVDIKNCMCFTEDQKHSLLAVLKNRIDKQGVLQVSSQQFRSQSANRNAALERLAELIAAALKPKQKRKKTEIPQRAIRKRLEDKMRRSKIKNLRSKPSSDE
jgi:ribosome-associated protein